MIKPNKLGGHAHVVVWKSVKFSIIQQRSYPINESWLNTPLITNSAGNLKILYIFNIEQNGGKSKANFPGAYSMPEESLLIILSTDCS